jgi:hypothetical protein
MSAEVRDCWQNPKGCREPTKCIRGNTRKPSDSQRHDESHQSEENNALDESHAATCCIMRQGWALGSMSVEIRWEEKVDPRLHQITTQEPPHGSFQLGCECNDNITFLTFAKPVSGRSATTQEFVPYGAVHEKAWLSGAPALETLVLPGSWGSYGTIPSKES